MGGTNVQEWEEFSAAIYDRLMYIYVHIQCMRCGFQDRSNLCFTNGNIHRSDYKKGRRTLTFSWAGTSHTASPSPPSETACTPMPTVTRYTRTHVHVYTTH